MRPPDAFQRGVQAPPVPPGSGGWKALQFYIDYDAVARDLSVDFSETEIAGERVVYACR